MKTTTIIITIMIFIIVLAIIYNRYIKFPHAKVISNNQNGISWTNGEARETITPKCVGVVGGTYSRKYDWKVQCLPNNQFRFIVHERGNDFAKVVDNIFSFNSGMSYLTK